MLLWFHWRKKVFATSAGQLLRCQVGAKLSSQDFQGPHLRSLGRIDRVATGTGCRADADFVAERDPEQTRQLESFRLARTEMQRQLELTTHQARKQQLMQAIEELDKRIAQLSK